MGLAELLHLLRRPLAPASPGESPRPRRGGPAEPPAPLPVTEPELLAALDSVKSERAAAEDVITEASGRRERLLLDPTSDDAILEAQRDLDRAQLALERLDAVEPELHARLRAIRHAARRERWIELRDQFEAAARRHAEIAAALEAERGTWEAARDLVLAEFADAAEVLPAWPLPPPGAVAAFPAALDRLSTTVHDPAPRPARVFERMEDVAEEARRTGVVPERARVVFGADLDVLLAERMRVRFVRPCRDASGEFHEAGEEMALPGPAARAEVQAGRAVMVEEG